MEGTSAIEIEIMVRTLKMCRANVNGRAINYDMEADGHRFCLSVLDFGKQLPDII